MLQSYRKTCYFKKTLEIRTYNETYFPVSVVSISLRKDLWDVNTPSVNAFNPCLKVSTSLRFHCLYKLERDAIS